MEEPGIGTLTHVLDRGFDNAGLFAFINNELEDRFVIRLKITRSSEQDQTTLLISCG